MLFMVIGIFIVYWYFRLAYEGARSFARFIRWIWRHLHQKGEDKLIEEGNK